MNETSPTASTPVRGATVRIVSGPEAGQARQVDGNGYYVFQALTPGAFSVEVSAPDFEPATINVTRPVTATARQNFNLRPALRTLDETYSGSISGGNTRCQTTLGSQPCALVTLNIHHQGTVEATLDWLPTTTDLDLDLYSGTTRLANSGGVRRNQEQISSAVSAGTYQFRIFYWDGSVISHYTLRVRRPN